jgi:DNA repair protein RadC
MVIMDWIGYNLSMDMDNAMIRTAKDGFDSSPYSCLERGPSLASTAELVGCVCRLSTAEAQAFLLDQVGPVVGNMAVGLRNLNRDEVNSRLSPARAGALLAAVELGRRAFGPTPLTDLIDDPESAAAQFADIAYSDVEQFAVLLLNIKNRLIAKQIISTGTVDETIALPRDVFRLDVKMNATAIIVGHNHPSGEPLASPEDLSLTQQLIKAGETLGIPVLDHLIVSQTDFTSIRRTTTDLWER